MRAYLAAPYAAREQVFHYARDLVRLDFDVTASWIEELHEINDGTIGAAKDLHPEEVARHALTDLDDIERCDLLVVFTGNFIEGFGYDAALLHSGGRHVETGYALAKGKPVFVVGEPENVFHRLPQVTVVGSWMELLGALAEHRDAGIPS